MDAIAGQHGYCSGGFRLHRSLQHHLAAVVASLTDETPLVVPQRSGPSPGKGGSRHSRKHGRAKPAPESEASLVDGALRAEEQGLRDQAMALLERAIERGSRSPEVACKIAVLNYQVGQYTQALDWSLRSIAFGGGLYWEGGYTLAATLQKMQRYREALEAYHSLLLLRPDEPRVNRNVAMLCTRLGLRSEAVRYLERAAAAEPQNLATACDLIHQQLFTNDWRDLELRAARVLARFRQSEQPMPAFATFALPGATAQDLRLAAVRQSQILEKNLDRRAILPSRTLDASQAERPLRVGYLCSDFHEHATAYLMARMFELHDRRQYRLYGYTWDSDPAGPTRQRIEAAFDVLRDIRDLGDAQAAALIHSDEIDLLVDLKGHTRDTRLGILAYRPAPVQAHHVGFPGTLGAGFVDYLVADRIVAPVEAQGQFTESLAYLPHCYQPTDDTRVIGPRPSRAASGLPEQGVVFCSFNQPYKIIPAVFDTWCRLLCEVKASVLWLLAWVGPAADNLHREAEQRGVDPQRLIFAPVAPQAEHLGRLQNADIFLDTLPVNAHTTASDALWAGVPVVTLPGQTFVSRVAASIVSAAGLPELIARDPEDYLRIAKELATQPGRLQQTKQRVQRACHESPLFDSERYTRDLEDLYRRMWKRKVCGPPAASLIAGSAS